MLDCAVLAIGVQALAALQGMLYNQDSWAVRLIFQTMDASALGDTKRFGEIPGMEDDVFDRHASFRCAVGGASPRPSQYPKLRSCSWTSGGSSLVVSSGPVAPGP